MTFRKYEKIHRLGKEEVEGILEGLCYIQEKIDGANTSIWMEDGVLHMGSRNNDITGRDFNGFPQYVYGHEGIQEFMRSHPNYRLYGEWLVRHTLPYPELAYKKFYLFDIFSPEEGYLPIQEVYNIAQEYGIEVVSQFDCIPNPTPEQLKEFVGKSNIGEKGEGIVIKNQKFINKFGERVCAKIVTEAFKEDNAVTFGGNNKFSDTYWEVWVVNKYMTLARIQKIMQKIQPLIDKKLDLEHIPRIAQTAYHDLITEEAWEIVNKAAKLDFNALKRIASKKAIQIYKEIITGDISIAHQ